MQALVENVKNTIISVIRGTGEITNAVTETVSGSLTTALKGTGAVGKALTESVADVASGAIRGTAQVGGDLGVTAKGAVMGVLKGTKELGGETLQAVGSTVQTLVRETADAVGGGTGCGTPCTHTAWISAPPTSATTCFTLGVSVRGLTMAVVDQREPAAALVAVIHDELRSLARVRGTEHRIACPTVLRVPSPRLEINRRQLPTPPRQVTNRRIRTGFVQELIQDSVQPLTRLPIEDV